MIIFSPGFPLFSFSPLSLSLSFDVDDVWEIAGLILTRCTRAHERERDRGKESSCVELETNL